MSDTAMNETIGTPMVGGAKKWLIVAMGVLGFATAYYLLPIQEWLAAFQNWVQGLGPRGWVIFILVYALTAFFLIPGSILTIGAGVAYGLWGFPLVIIGATLGSAISFLAARYLFKERVQEKVAQYPRFNAVNQAIGEGGWKVVGLLRLSPALPFSLQNWFLGITPIGFWPSQIATFFGIMPGTLLYVYIASLGGSAAAESGDDMSLLKYAALGIGLVATIVVTVMVTKKANAKLKEFSV